MHVTTQEIHSGRFFFLLFLQKYPKTKGDLGALPALYSECCFPEERVQALISGKVSCQCIIPWRQSWAHGEQGRQNSFCSHCWLPNIYHSAPDFNPAGSVTLQAQVSVKGGGRQRMWSPQLDGLAFENSSTLGSHTLYSLNSRITWEKDCVTCCGALEICIRVQTSLDLNTKHKIKNRNGKGQDHTGVQCENTLLQRIWTS